MLALMTWFSDVVEGRSAPTGRTESDQNGAIL